MEVLGGSWRLAGSAQLRSGERRSPDCARRNLACQFRGPKSCPWCSNDRLVRRQRLARRRCRPRPEICGYVRFYILHRQLGHDAQSSSAFGFTEVTRVWIGARPLRPLRQMLTHQVVNWKLALRIARNWRWSSSPARTSYHAWQTVAMEPSEIPTGSISASQSFFAVRSPAFFEYLSRCPSVPYQLHRISNDNGLQGYFALGILRGQARIGGVWLCRPCEEHWRPLIRSRKRLRSD